MLGRFARVFLPSLPPVAASQAAAAPAWLGRDGRVASGCTGSLEAGDLFCDVQLACICFGQGLIDSTQSKSASLLLLVPLERWRRSASGSTRLAALEIDWKVRSGTNGGLIFFSSVDVEMQ